ncbi:MAG TPA: hypothetical protein VLF67_00055 [Candidatus Saccharimonas sp.]|nr:hypothetical protein [Candidatus Saccharimonas sp.]
MLTSAFYRDLAELTEAAQAQPGGVDAPALRSGLHDLLLTLGQPNFDEVPAGDCLAHLLAETRPPRQVVPRDLVLRELRTVADQEPARVSA